MIQVSCPNCGPRNVQEFRYGGELNPRPRLPAAASTAEWANYLYMRENRLGLRTEWWYHRHGCGLWFLAERHTHTNEIQRTYRWQQPGSPMQDQAGDR